MSNPHYHAKSSVLKFGDHFPGLTYDYALAIHNYFDSTKVAQADYEHRAILHNTFGHHTAFKIFGFNNLNNLICEQHLKEDTGFCPTVDDWWDHYHGKTHYKVKSTEFICEMHAKKFGGKPSDYLAVNEFLDSYSNFSNNPDTINLTHNSYGCFLAEFVFDTAFTRESDGKEVPTRVIAETHIRQEFKTIPSLSSVVDGSFNKTEDTLWQYRGVASIAHLEG